MRRAFVAAAAFTIVGAGSVMAADMPIKAPAPNVVSDWTGFYVGFHGGYGWGRTAIAGADLNSPLPNTDDIDPLHAPRLKGAVFGGHAGYNWQWGQRGVVGLEIDYSSTRLRETQTASGPHDVIGTRNDPPEEPDTRTLKAKLDRLASVRARVGFLVGPDFLLYGTAGVASGHANFTDTFVVHSVFNGTSDVSTATGRASANQFGWAAGAGGEWKLWSSGLMLRVEYLHYDFGRTFLAFDGIRNDTMHLDKLTTNVVRGGISYKF
jgi:opacity protein-like surface antigen